MIASIPIKFKALKQSICASYTLQDLLAILLVFIFPLCFLSIKHGVHVSLYGIFLLYIFELIKGSAKIHLDKKSIFIFISLSSLLIATAVQQTTTLNLNLSAWDGPSRLLIASFVLLYLYQKDINYLKILEIAIPIALILLCAYLSINQKYYWGHRWANVFVDPNSLGSQSTILSMICLLSVSMKSSAHINFLKILGAICGLYVSIKAQSRGGWVAIPFITICWFIIQANRGSSNLKKNDFIKIISASLALVIALILTATFVESVNARLIDTVVEISTWFKDPSIYTSAGSRMSMWVASIQLISENPFGYGEISIKEIALHHQLYSSVHHQGMIHLINAGPHSDILSKGLSLGLLGIAAYLSTIFIPFAFFLKNSNHTDPNVRKVAEIALIYITGIFIAGLFNETLSLKYLCSFYGLMIACLASQALCKIKQSEKQKACFES